jgi:signal transduction histidine kinase
LEKIAAQNIHIITFLFIVFILLLFFAGIFLFSQLVKKDRSRGSGDNTAAMTDAFNIVGSEIKSLREQLMLKERLAALGEVSAGIAHELRNPMAVIAGNAKLLLKDIEMNDSSRDTATAILHEIEEMNMIIEELLEFSKSGPVAKTKVDVKEMISDIIKGIPHIGGSIKFDCPNPIYIKADGTLLRQSVKNIIINACEAGDLVNIAIEEYSDKEKEGIIISISDNGHGIADDEKHKIFMPFYTNKKEGHGIGLALAQKIVLGHGGNISVQSKEGSGSIFKIFLPAK